MPVAVSLLAALGALLWAALYGRWNIAGGVAPTGGRPPRWGLADGPKQPSAASPSDLARAAAAELDVVVPAWRSERRDPPIADNASLVRNPDAGADRLRVDDFLEALIRVAAGGTALDPAIVSALVTPTRLGDPVSELSAREREVLELVAEGKSNTSISRELVIAERTVETHMRAIFRKLHIDEDEGSHRRVLAVLAHLTRPRSNPYTDTARHEPAAQP